MDVAVWKPCPRCGEARHRYKNKAAPTGLDSWCSVCVKAKVKTWANENPHRIREYNRQKRYTRHGLTKEQFQAMGDSCEVCGSKEFLHIDHDHAHCPGPVGCSECVRGLLCSGCNMLVGFIEGGKLEAALRYVEGRSH